VAKLHALTPDGIRNMIIKTVSRDRSKIVLEQRDQIKHWSRHFGVTRDELARVVAKVGNSAAAVRKELAKLKSRLITTTPGETHEF
jgi:Protein of unknown function (DUF3606)